MDKVTLEWWIKHSGFLEEERDKWREQALKAAERIKELESELRRVETEYSKNC